MKSLQTAILWVVFALALFGQSSQLFELNNHLWQRIGVTLPPMVAGDQPLGFWKLPQGTFLYLLERSKVRASIFRISNSGIATPWLDDSQLQGDRLAFIDQKGQFAGLTLISPTKKTLYFTTYCEKVNVTNCGNWKVPLATGQPEKLPSLGDTIKVFETVDTGKGLGRSPIENQTIQEIWRYYTTPDDGEEFVVLKTKKPASNQSGFLIDGGIYKVYPDRTFELIVRVNGLDYVQSVFGLWPTKDSIMYIMASGGQNHLSLWVYDRNKRTKRQLLNMGTMFQGFSVQDFFPNTDMATNSVYITLNPFSPSGQAIFRFGPGLFDPPQQVVLSTDFVDNLGPVTSVRYMTVDAGTGVIPVQNTSKGYTALASWNGRLSKLLAKGDVMEDGKPVAEVALKNTASFSYNSGSQLGCTTAVLPLTADFIPDGRLYEVVDPCIKQVAQGNTITLSGDNLAPAGFTVKVMDNEGHFITPSSVMSTAITFPASELSPGNHSLRIIAGQNVRSNAVSLYIDVPAVPLPVIDAVKGVMPATLVPGPVTPGSLATVMGKDFSTSRVDNASSPFIHANRKPGDPLPTTLFGCSVLFDGKPVPVTFCATFADGTAQANFQVPPTADPKVSHTIQIQSSTIDFGKLVGTSQALPLQLAAINPSFFGTKDYPVILQIANRGNALQNADNPIQAGDTFVGYAVGFGETSLFIPEGLAAADVSDSIVVPTAPIQAWIHTMVKGETSYYEISAVAFASPQFPGLYQVNFTVPPEFQSDTAQGTLVVKVGDQYTREMPIALAPAAPAANPEQ